MKKVLYLVLCLFIGVSTYAQEKKTVKRKAVKSYTTEQAVVYAEDYFEFYEANTPYRSPPIALNLNFFFWPLNMPAGIIKTNAGTKGYKDAL